MKEKEELPLKLETKFKESKKEEHVLCLSICIKHLKTLDKVKKVEKRKWSK